MCRVYKEFQDWNEATIDCLALSLYQLQIYYLNETKRGMSGFGQYHLKDKYRHLKADYYALQCINADSPEDIVKNIKEGNTVDGEKLPELGSSKNDSELTGFQTISDAAKDFELLSALDIDQHLFQSEILERGNELNSLKPTSYSLARAHEIVRNEYISFLPKFRLFIIKLPKEVARVVKLYPKPNCSCQNFGECYHITAAKISLGMKVEEQKVITNLTKLRKNGRGSKEKRSGRKKPRPMDVSGMVRVFY